MEDLSFCANPGETVGIIGPTGCGKTTLVNLVPRFYDAQEGAILVDGIEVGAWDMDALRQKIGVAPQKPLLFSGTIAENLRWAKEDATDAEMRAAAFACL